MFYRVYLLFLIYFLRKISNTYILYSIIINLSKIKDFIIYIYTSLFTLVHFFFYFFLNNK